MIPTSIAIIGGGHAGDELAVQLREEGFRGALIVLEGERGGPYERPPLSKEFLVQNLDAAAISARSDSVYQRLQINRRSGSSVDAIEPGANDVGVLLSSGEKLSVDVVALATGVAPRQLTMPGSDALGVFNLQGLSDAITLRHALQDAESVVVVGGGFIGAETASSARLMGKEVTLIEYGPRLMSRAVSETVSSFYESQHRSAGVNLLLETGVQSVDVSPEGRVSSVTTSLGDVIPTTCVVAAIGVVPRTEIALQAGLELDRGFLVVDDQGRTSHPRVFGIGDIALFPHPRGLDERVPIPSIDNASWTAAVVARTLVGDEAPSVRPTPTFWTEQYGLRAQIAGLSQANDRSVVRGDPIQGKFSVLHYQHDRMIAVEAIGAPRDYQAVKRALSLGINIPADLAAWSDLSLGDIVSSILGKTQPQS